MSRNLSPKAVRRSPWRGKIPCHKVSRKNGVQSLSPPSGLHFTGTRWALSSTRRCTLSSTIGARRHQARATVSWFRLPRHVFSPYDWPALHDHLVRFFAAYTCEIHDVSSFCANKIKSVDIIISQDAPHEALVEHYTTQWALFAAGVRLIESLFHCLDRRITAEHEGEMDTSTTVSNFLQLEKYGRNC